MEFDITNVKFHFKFLKNFVTKHLKKKKIENTTLALPLWQDLYKTRHC